MKQKTGAPKKDLRAIKFVAVFVLAVLVVAALILAERKAREPKLITGYPERYTLSLEDMEEGFQLLESSDATTDDYAGWVKRFSKKEGDLEIELTDSVYIYHSIEAADLDYGKDEDRVLNELKLTTHPGETLGEKSIFYNRIIVMADHLVPNYEAMFKKRNVVVFVEVLPKGEAVFDLNSFDFALDYVKRYAKIQDGKIELE